MRGTPPDARKRETVPLIVLPNIRVYGMLFSMDTCWKDWELQLALEISQTNLTEDVQWMLFKHSYSRVSTLVEDLPDIEEEYELDPYESYFPEIRATKRWYLRETFLRPEPPPMPIKPMRAPKPFVKSPRYETMIGVFMCVFCYGQGCHECDCGWLYNPVRDLKTGKLMDYEYAPHKHVRQDGRL